MEVVREPAHQYKIRLQEAARERRPTLSLDGAYVTPVSRAWAEEIILRYEWLGTMGKAQFLYGLRAADGTPMGVACFGPAPGTNSHMLCGKEYVRKSICLERGACVHYAHPHAGSFLVSRAVDLVHKDAGANVIFAYSDPQAGEIGTIYQACNWHYIGVTGRKAGYRWKGRQRQPDGSWGPWKSSRVLRAGGLCGEEAWQAARASDDWQFVKDLNKARYVTFAGNKRERRDARRALRYPILPYPKRDIIDDPLG